MAAFWERDAVVAPQGGPQPVFTAPQDPRDLERSANEAERLRIAQTQAEIAQGKFGMEQADREQRGGANTTESEKTAAFLATRVADEVDLLGGIVGGQTPNVTSEAARWAFGDLAANVLNDEDRQRVEAAQLNILDAALTLGTGAAYTREQLINYQRSYFPQIGDQPGTVADKKRRLESLLAAARVKAGAAAPAIDRALAAVRGDQTKRPKMIGDVPVGTEVELGMDRWGGEGFDRNAALMDVYGVTPNQEATLVAFWNRNRGNSGLTAEGVRDFYASLGIPAPSDADIQSRIEAAKAGANFSGLDTSAAEQEWNRRVEERASQNAALYGEPGVTDLAGHGIAAGLTDEAQGIGAAIFAMAQGKSPEEAYRFANDVRDYELSRARDNTGAGGTVAEIVGNAASLGIGSTLPSTARNAVKEAATAGAVPGFGYGEGGEESAGGAAIGAGAGAFLGKVLTRGGSPKPPNPGTKVVQAADDLNARTGSNIIPLPADVGGATVRRATGGVAQSTFGAKPIVDASQAVTTETGKAVRSIAEEVGTPAELEAAGVAALTGAQKWMKSTGTKVNALYTRARKLSEGVAVPLTNARATLTRHIEELEATPGGAEGIEKLRALQEEIAGDYTVDGIKRMRTTLRDRFMGDGLRKTDMERRVGQIIDAAEQDVADGLVAAGKPEAAQAWTKAAAEHRKRLQVIDNTLAPIIGKRSDAPRSGEQIMKAIDGLTKSDNAKLAKFIRALPDEEAGTVRSTVISRLGTRNADADDFSLNTFLTQWGKMTPGAKRTLFGGELTEALDKVATVATGSQQAQRYANFSNTGSAAWAGANLGGAVAGIVPGAFMVAGQYGAGRLLASPAFARWLARMPKNPAAARKHIEGLSRIAAAESAIAQDALGLQRQLIEAFEGGSLPLAAQPVPAGQPQGADSTETAGAAR